MKQQDETRDYTIRSVDRALQALQCFHGTRREISLMEFSALLGLNKSTAFRILTTLRNAGFVEQAADGRYTLGPEIARLSRLVDGDDYLKRAAEPVLRTLARISGETISLCKYGNGRMTCIGKVESEKVLKCMCVLNSDVPMLKGATGRAVAAFLPREERLRCIDVQRRIGNPYCAPEELEPVFRTIRRNGYHISHSEYDEAVNALGVPIFGKGGEVLGSLSVVGPAIRFVDDRILALL